jgi:hypothetical protein
MGAWLLIRTRLKACSSAAGLWVVKEAASPATGFPIANSRFDIPTRLVRYVRFRNIRLMMLDGLSG